MSMSSIMMRSTVPRAACGPHYAYTRFIHATPLASKSVTDKVSEVAEKVNKKVGAGLASAIETGERATEKTKETLGTSTKSAKEKGEEAKQTAQQTVEHAKQKANEVGTRAQETKENVKKDL
ncbi:hypothetical protein BDN67DRAFT_1007304 [Paxillus ammoniavirescens]|nr:hypothetical protein BDN67DRAFT_1007304 [Paxillus ammoniavirescens]